MNFSLPAELLEATRLTKAGQLTEATAALQRMLGAGLPVTSASLCRGDTVPPTIDGVVDGPEMVQPKLAPPDKQTFSDGVEDSAFRIKNKLINPAVANSLRGFIDQIRPSRVPLPGGLGHRAPSSHPRRFAERRRIPGLHIQQSGRQPALQALRAQRLPWPVCALDRHAARLHPVPRRLRGRHAHERGSRGTYLPRRLPRADQLGQHAEMLELVQRGRPAARCRRALAHRGNYARSDARLRHRPAVRLHCGAFGGRRRGRHHGRCLPRSVRRDRRAFWACLWCGARHALGIRGDAGQWRSGAEKRAHTAPAGSKPRVVPAIVFHGDKDTTVNPRNADSVVAQSGQGASLRRRVEKGQVAGGLAYSRILHADASGETVVEQWVIHGAGHAWSGGSPAGSYTLPQGPDATGEMVRFFLEHPLP